MAEGSSVVAPDLPLGLFTSGDHQDQYQEATEHLGDPLQALLDGRVRTVEFFQDQVVVDAPRKRRVYLPGSFNPPHEGHAQLLTRACESVPDTMEGCFELSVGNADKGLLSLEEVKRRVASCTEHPPFCSTPLVVTSAPLFVQKAELFRDSAFAVGYDTAIRLVMKKYYGDSFTEMALSFARLRYLGATFLVGGRKDNRDGVFRTIEEVDIPRELSDLFVGLPESSFRVDISSTELRAKARMAQTWSCKLEESVEEQAG